MTAQPVNIAALGFSSRNSQPQAIAKAGMSSVTDMALFAPTRAMSLKYSA